MKIQLNKFSYRYYALMGLFFIFTWSYPSAYFRTNSLQEGNHQNRTLSASVPQATLDININSDNTINGKFLVYFSSSYVGANLRTILPFNIKQIKYNTDNFYVLNNKLNQKYTVLDITPLNAPEELIASFQVDANIRDTFDVNAGINAPDFLLIEKRNDAQYILRFRFDTQLSDHPFDGSNLFTENILVPSQIKLHFSRSLYFYPLSYPDFNLPYDGQYNVAPVFSNETIDFDVPISFFQEQTIWINYGLPPSKTVSSSQPSLLFHLLSLIALIVFLALIGVISNLPSGSTPYDIISEKARFRFIVVLVAIPLILITFILIFNPSSLFAYIFDSLDTMITSIISISAYLIIAILILFRLMKIVRHQSPAQPGASTTGSGSPQPGASTTGSGSPQP